MRKALQSNIYLRRAEDEDLFKHLLSFEIVLKMMNDFAMKIGIPVRRIIVHLSRTWIRPTSNTQTYMYRKCVCVLLSSIAISIRPKLKAEKDKCPRALFWWSKIIACAVHNTCTLECAINNNNDEFH